MHVQETNDLNWQEMHSLGCGYDEAVLETSFLGREQGE